MGVFDFLFGKNGEYFHRYPDNDWNRDFYKNDKRHGVCEYGHNFRTQGKIEYKNGKKDGKATYFLPDGDIYKEMHYKKDVLEGPFRIWNEKKILVTAGEHSNGVRHGRWRDFDSDGAVKLDVTYDMGELTSVNFIQREHNFRTQGKPDKACIVSDDLTA